MSLRRCVCPSNCASWTRLNTGQAIAVATLFALLEETYGPATIPEVLTQTQKHRRWHNVVNASIGISSAEFESGWLAYLRSRPAADEKIAADEH